jgi:hypothetical protein
VSRKERRERVKGKRDRRKGIERKGNGERKGFPRSQKILTEKVLSNLISRNVKITM